MFFSELVHLKMAANNSAYGMNTGGLPTGWHYDD
jgi:hypothetical protein